MMKTVKWVLITGVAALFFLVAVNIVSVEKNNEASVKTVVQTQPQTQTQTQTSIDPNKQTSPIFKPETMFTPENLPLPDNTFVYDSRRVDVNSDGKADDVVLIGEKQEDNNPYVKNIRIAVKDGHTGKFSTASIGELNMGLEPKLFMGSFTKDKSNDILVSLATGGSGGIEQYSLMGYKEGQVVSIVPQKELNAGLSLETECLPGFTLKVTDKGTGYAATIDLHKGAADYESLGIYNQKGDLLKDPMVLVDGFGVLKPVDDNKDGIYELHGSQMISVGAHANGVAKADSIWTVVNGQLKLSEENIAANK